MRIPIVNEQDEIMEYKESEGKDPKDISRVTSMWVTDSDGNVLLAQRSFSKKRSPGLWGPSVAGTVEEGETYESNIIKEAEEEIGLIGLKPALGPKIRVSASHEFFCQWFTCIVDHNYPFVKQDVEVEEIRWFSKNEIIKLLEEKPEIFISGFKRYFNMF
jgi:isopentenyldiphosphate isomerase